MESNQQLAAEFRKILEKYNFIEQCGHWTLDAIQGLLSNPDFFFSLTKIPRDSNGIQAYGELINAKDKVKGERSY